MNVLNEESLAQFLIDSPDFFERHAQVLATVRLTSPFGKRAVSLQERQAEMLRDKIKVLERRMMELLRSGNENGVIAEKIVDFAEYLLHVKGSAEMAQHIESDIAQRFAVPQVRLILAGGQETNEETEAWLNAQTQPYCGAPPEGSDLLRCLSEPANVQSMAVLSLKRAEGGLVGALVLASPDSQRYHSGIGTDFLQRLAALVVAALT